MGRHTEFRLSDVRGARTDTDYRVLNGGARPVFRINIKFHGGVFRRAAELVGLAPEDCFALATYKIHLALRKQDEENLPYVFVVVGVRGLSADDVGRSIPDALTLLCASVAASTTGTPKRDVEDAIVHALRDRPADFGVEADVRRYFEAIRSARWFALSARRAETVLRERLFDRVFALRVPRFARNYPNAELALHFSLTNDLIPVEAFLQVLRDSGIQGLVGRLERGTM